MRILIAESSPTLRDMLRTHCREVLRHRSVELNGSLEELAVAFDRPRPDVILLAVELAEQATTNIIQAIRDSGVPRPGFLVYGLGCCFQRMRHLESIQVNGYFDLGTENLAALGTALGAVGAERSYFSDSFLRQQNARRDNPCAYSKILSERQISILQCVARFQTDMEISRGLGLSVRTVEWHRHEIMRRLEKPSLQALLKFAWDHGFVPSPPAERPPSKIRALPAILVFSAQGEQDRPA